MPKVYDYCIELTVKRNYRERSDTQMNTAVHLVLSMKTITIIQVASLAQYNRHLGKTRNSSL